MLNIGIVLRVRVRAFVTAVMGVSVLLILIDVNVCDVVRHVDVYVCSLT